MIAFKCQACGIAFKVSDDKAGKKGKCPKCDTVITIPIPTSQAVSSVSPAAPLPAVPTKESAAAEPAPAGAPSRKSRMPLVLAVCVGVAVLAVIAVVVVGGWKKEPSELPSNPVLSGNSAPNAAKAVHLDAVADLGASASSTDGKLKGIIIHYPPPKIKNADEFANPQEVIEGLTLFGAVLPEWGIYDGNPGKLVAIGYGTLPNGGGPAVFRCGWWSTPLGGTMFNFEQGALYYPVKASEQNSGGKTVVFQRLAMKQQILSKTELSAKFGNRTVSIVEVHSSSPTIAHEEDSPPAGVIEAALPFLIEDGSLRPQWGLFCKEDSGDGIGNLWLEGKRNPGTTLIHYDNSQTACANLDHGIYESDGRGSLKLMDVMTTRPSTMPSGVIGSQR